MSESSPKKLNENQKHILKLIVRGSNSEGWASVGAFIYPLIKEIIPPEMIELETVGKEGRGRVRLTEFGMDTIIMNAMEFL